LVGVGVAEQFAKAVVGIAVGEAHAVQRLDEVEFVVGVVDGAFAVGRLGEPAQRIEIGRGGLRGRASAGGR
jgi:hypothetical protein